MSTKDTSDAPAKRVNPEFEMVSEGCPCDDRLDEIPHLLSHDGAANGGTDDDPGSA